MLSGWKVDLPSDISYVDIKAFLHGRVYQIQNINVTKGILKFFTQWQELKDITRKIAVDIFWEVQSPVLTYISGVSDDKIRFLVVGDWGGLSFHPYTTPVQTSVADQMASVASQEGVDFVVALGDNFYLYGVSNVDDERFQVQ